MNTSLNIKHFFKTLKSISPVKLIVWSFFIIIVVGTILLCLPISARSGRPTSLIDSFFIATSATCVTGLSVFDTWTNWSVFGQVIILMLIQLGGLGLITFTTGMTLLLRHKLGLRDMQIMHENTNGMVVDISHLTKTIIVWSFFCEAIGSLFLMTRFVPRFGLHGIWISFFTAVSSYCNAGFDILGFTKPGISLCDFNSDPVVTITISLLIIVGGIGFLVVTDVNSWVRKKFKNKKSHPHLKVHSIVAISTSIVLLLLGTILFFLFENNNTLKDMNFFEKINASFFQSTSARTAGFFTVPIKDETASTKFFTIILMFIGASPASTGGGIKTTTFIVLMSTVISVLKGRSETVILKHKVSKNTVYKSLTIVTIGLFLVCTAALTIDALESAKKIASIDIFFETVSAFATVGLTAGITDLLSNASKLILAFAMFVGRVGPISLILSLTTGRNNRYDSILPDGKIVVG